MIEHHEFLEKRVKERDSTPLNPRKHLGTSPYGVINQPQDKRMLNILWSYTY